MMMIDPHMPPHMLTNTQPADDLSDAPESFDSQLFDQVVARAMKDMEARTNEIKESFEKMNEDF